MATPVTISAEPLVFDTLPALKVQFYPQKSYRGDIYTFARLYFLKDALQLSLSVFEQHPPAQSQAELLLAGRAEDFLRLVLSPEQAGLWLHRAATEAEPLAFSRPAQRFQSSDEQGWSWGARLAISPEQLALVGVRVAPEAVFRAGLLKTWGDEDAFGASFEVPAGQSPRTPALLGDFQAVNY